MKKILTTFSVIVIILFGLSLFGWMVSHIVKGDNKKFGFLTEIVKFMYTFPDLFTQSVEEVKTLPKTFIPTPDNFKSINKLEEDVIILNSYSDTSDSRSIVLMNLRNDSILYKWTVKNPHLEHDRIINPILLPNRSIIYSFDCISGLKRIDSLSNLMWRQDSIKHHHSTNFDEDGNIWICSFEPVYHATGMYKLDGRTVFYIDDYITKVDPETGRILFHKSITEILKDNNLANYLLKSANAKDPLHINDAQPAPKTTPYYEKGDLFISSRNMSAIVHYRPSTNKVIKMIEGPFTSQHDVDFYNDSSLVWINNNYYNTWTKKSMAPPKDSSYLQVVDNFCSNIIKYDLWNDSMYVVGEEVFRKNNIHTPTEGLIDYIDPSTVFVEEQNTGVIWILRNDEVIYKNVLKSQHKGHHHLPNWIRIIK